MYVSLSELWLCVISAKPSLRLREEDANEPIDSTNRTELRIIERQATQQNKLEILVCVEDVS